MSASLASPGPARRSPDGSVFSPEEIVSGKLSRFAQERLGIVQAMARKYKVKLPEEVEAFFQAASVGNWEEAKGLFESLQERRKKGELPEGFGDVWAPILETFGVAEAVHDWPPRGLLDYGNKILDSLHPGMVYVGGTDPGRFIPTLLNETSDGERHIVLTQNALADASYLQYVDFLYQDKLHPLTSEDSQQAFQSYLSDAQKRVKHDQEFPDEPKQVRPGEDIKIKDNRVQVSGQVAVMAINEELLTRLMNKNPDLTFGLEESFPLKSTYGDAVPLGPIMELRSPDSQNSYTSENAAQVVDYWNNMAATVLASDSSPEGSPPRKTYSKMASGQANLLAAHGFADEAEQAYRVAAEIEPSSPEAVFGLAQLLANNGRSEEAQRMVEAFHKSYPNVPSSGWSLILPAGR